jgi:large subunit ribosomal protein L28
MGFELACPDLRELNPEPAATPLVREPKRQSATLFSLMAKVCHSCGKGPSFGNSRSHSMVATKRRFNPNLQKVRVLIDKAPQRVYVCTRCLKAGKVTKAV